LVSDYITRGTQQATVTVTVDGAIGSPVSVPVTLYGDDTFPYPDGGASDDDEVEAGTPEPAAGGPPAADNLICSNASGCGCALGGAPPAAPWLSLLGLALAALSLRRRWR
jgi:MYXO-CTERM domain-containing protein